MDDQMINALMRLRLAYLRVIAKSWRDEDFKKTIVNTGDIFHILKEFGFDSPWEYLEFHLVDNGPKTVWKPKETGGWIGSNDAFRLKIPAKPANADYPEQALAAYYQLFPTLFGPSKEEGTDESIKAAVNASSNLDLGVGPEPFLEFGALTLRAIALAWANEDFRRDLLNPEKKEDAKPVLSRWLGYTCPWNFDIHFEEHPDYKWQENSGTKKFEWNPAKTEKKIPKNIIELHYPEKPEEQQFYAIALTAYNVTGPAYPFSCG